MRVALRSLLVCVLGCLAGQSWLSTPVYAEEGPPPAGASAPSVGSPLAPPALEALAGSQGGVEEEARRANPEAVLAREVSAHAYEGLDSESAAEVAARSFPSMVDQANGPLTFLPSGQKVTGYLGPYTATLNEEDGQRALAVSSVPVAVETSPTSWGPIGLALHGVGGAFEPDNPLVSVRAPKALSEGIALLGVGITVTPVSGSQESSSGSEGMLYGSSIFYANSQTDSDTVFKPATFGFAIDTLLRSADSPERISFRIGLPAGASLVTPPHGAAGTVRIVREATTIATIPAPRAFDAAGTRVPLLVDVTGDILTISMAHKSGEYLFPIDVDPEFNTSSEGLVVGNWHHSEALGGGFSFEDEGELRISKIAPFPKNNWAYWATETKGDSKIYAQGFTDFLEPEEAEGGTLPVVSAWIELFKEGGEKSEQELSGTPYVNDASICAAAGCSEAGGSPGNVARFEITSLESSAEATAKEEFAQESEAWYGGSITSTVLLLSQPKETHSTISYNTSSPEIEYTSGGKRIKTQNALYGSNGWIGPGSGALEFESADGGLGVAATNLEAGGSFDEKNFQLEQNGCLGVQCVAKQHEVVTWSTVTGHVSNGLNKFRANAHDAMSGTSSAEHGEGETTLKVDTEAPHGIKISGLPIKGEDYEMGEAEVHLKAEATDGEGSIPSSGIKSLGLEVDGRAIGAAGGSCPSGPCTASTEWAINGAELGTGAHIITIVATDNAGNINSSNFQLLVHHANPIAMGPGSVNPESGDFALEAGDVDMSGGMGPLTVSRHFDSRNPTEGAEGPLGPQWTISLNSVSSLEVLPDSSVLIVGPEGLTHFSKTAGGFEAPVGDSNLTLVLKGSEYILTNKDKGTSTIFTRPEGSISWMATTTTGALATDTMTDEYETVEVEAGKKIARPKLELAPHPSATCLRTKIETKWEAPCRGLLLEYAETTTAKSETEWGNYKHRLKEVISVTYNSANLKEPHLTSLAKYEYDSQGRLRVEWDPRISPALKTIYGYNNNGDITAISPPGQEPWLMTYGAAAADTSIGRLISVSRPSASTGLGGTAPTNTASPTISNTSPSIGATVTVTTGTWSNTPEIYSYQWYDCISSGTQCTPISGATNPTYHLTTSDGTHILRAEVVATNAGGSSNSTTQTAAIPAREAPRYESGGRNVESAVTTNYSGKNVRFYVDRLPVECRFANGGGPIEKKGAGGVSLRFTYCKAEVGGCTTPETLILTFATQIVYGAAEEKQASPHLFLRFSMNTPQEITIEGSGCPVKGTFRIMGNIVGTVSKEVEEVGTHEVKFEGSSYEETPRGYQFEGYEGQARLLANNVYPVTLVGTFTASVEGTTYSEHVGEALTSSSGEPPTPPSPGSTAVTTIEYGVPISGSGAPAELSSKEAEKWGQTDDPVEAAAIFPPDEPMGWPAKDYTRATVYYFDSNARTVNVKSPSGAISTMEYNEDNNAVRSLSASNRATALKETCESKEKCKSAETSKTLDTESKYGHEGTELEETIGPQHSIKLANGAEVQARSHTKYFYDEGVPVGEEHGLVTRTVESTLVGTKEEEPRTTRTYYSGQKGLGWKLREPTSVVVNPEGLALTYTTVYNEGTGSVVETKAPGGTSETVYPPAFTAKFGSEGAGKGQFNHPLDVAVDAAGGIWVDDRNNDRMEKFSSTGSFVAEYGSKGAGNDQFSNPWALAINQSSGNVYVADTGNNRIEELNSSGAFVATFGTEGAGKLKEPEGVTVDSSGDVWVSDSDHNRIVEFSYTGVFMREFGSYGTGNGQLENPEGLTISEGSLYVVDSGNDRIEQFSLTGAYLNQFGSKGSGSGQLSEPVGIAANPTSGDLFVADRGNHRIEEFSPAGKYLTSWATWSETHEISSPMGLTINAAGKLYIADEEGAMITEWLPPETGAAHLNYGSTFGSKGSGSGQFAYPVMSAIDGHGNIWITDYGNHRIQEFSATGTFIAAYGKYGSGNGEFDDPQGIDINQSTGNVYVADAGNNRIEELSSTGEFIRAFGTSGSGELDDPEGVKIDSSGNVWVADTDHNRIAEFSSTGTYIAAYGSKGSGNGQFYDPTDIAFSGSNLYVTDSGNHRVQEFSNTGTYINQFGTEGSGSGEFYTPEGIAADSAGNLYIVDGPSGRVQEFTATGAFLASFATKGSGEGQLDEPTGISINAAGDMYVDDTGENRIEEWTPADQAAHDTKTIYYTAKGEAEVEACQNHPEWVNLVCQTEPAAQPEDNTLPTLPVTIVEDYNIWDEPELTKETFKEPHREADRLKYTTYDSAGRPISNLVYSELDKTVPTVEDKYDSKLGVLTEEITKTEGKEEIIKKTVNTLGQLEQYKDADGGVTTYKHDVDGRTTEVASVIEAGGKKESTYQKYTYESPSGFMSKLEDSGAGTFKVTRNIAGQITTETYPNAMTATDTYSATGEPISIRYEKTAHCEKTCPEIWFKETTVPSAHGETFERANTLATDTYGYDADGRLTQVQETPTGKGCVTRLYGYDEESDRTSLTSRAPTNENKCATEGGTVETHHYDPADRLIDNGVSYETFGNTTKLPGADAGGPEMEITSEFYVDNQVASQTQDGKSYKYFMDPVGRVRETKTETTGKPVLETVTHYAGPGSALSWTNEEEAKKWTQWTRDIPGIDGTLTAIQSSSGKVTLQIHDLQGDVVETASDLESETKVLTSYNSTEFGAPLNGTPPTKYTWLGAEGVSNEASGLITQDGVTYVPQTGRPLQTQGIALPTAENKATAYISMISPGIEASAAAASAQQVANAEQAKKALGGGNERPGLTVSEEFGSECTGSDACASSRISCKITLMFGEPAPNLLFAGSIFTCSKPVLDFELQVVILVESDPECGASCGFENLKWNKTPDGRLGEILEDTSSGRAYTEVGYCAEGIGYRAWTWGKVFGSHNFVSKGQETGVVTCTGKGSHDFYAELIDAGYDLEPGE